MHFITLVRFKQLKKIQQCLAISQSCDFHPYALVPCIPVPSFPPLWFGPTFSSPDFSSPAFLPRDAMHPRSWPWACVCLSVRSRSSVEMAEWIEPVFGMWASFHPSYTVLKANSVISKNKGTSLWNIVLNSGLRKFRHGTSIVEMCYQLSSRKVDDQSVINWAIVGQLSR